MNCGKIVEAMQAEKMKTLGSLRSKRDFFFSFFLLLVVIVFSLPAQAATSSARVKKQTTKADANPEINQDINIPLAKGELQAEVAAAQDQFERANAPKTTAEIGVSNWQPMKLTMASRIRGASDFETVGMPALNVALFSPLSRVLEAKLGLGFLAMHRVGNLTATGVTVPVEQKAYIASLRLGVAYSPWTLLNGIVRPYLTGALLPTMIITRRSSFDDGVDDVGMAGEVGAGTQVQIWKPINLDIAVSRIFGKVQDSDLGGFAASAALRFPI